MAEFKLERFKYNWLGDWQAGYSYNRDDIVRYGGKSYVCLITHVSNVEFHVDLEAILPGSIPPQPQPKWKVMTDAKEFAGYWTTGTVYKPGDIVLFDGTLWECADGHTATSFENTEVLSVTVTDGGSGYTSTPTVIFTAPVAGGTTATATAKLTADEVTNVYIANGGDGYTSDDIPEVSFTGGNGTGATATATLKSRWQVFASHIQFNTDWEQSTGYGPGALVKYNGIVYKCITAHTSQTLLEDDLAKWVYFHNGIEYVGAFTNAITYRVNDLVLYGGSIFRCVETHTSSAVFNDAKFEIELPGYRFDGDYDANSYYSIGDIVRHGGDLYYALTSSFAVSPTAEPPDGSTQHWTKLLYAYNYRGDWELGNLYLPGDLVRRGGELYKAIVEIPSGSVDDYTDNGKWELVVPGQKHVNYWQAGTAYNVGEVVYYFGDAWKCNTAHTSSNNNYPGDNGSGFFYWDLFIQAGVPAGTNKLGDLLTYNLNRTEAGDGSSFGSTAVTIGSAEQRLSVDDDENVFWRNFYSAARVVYVSTNGIDEAGRGLVPNKPFRTIRYACQYVEDNVTGPCKIQVSTGTYEEVGPMSVPRYTVVYGDELRSVTIKANSPKTEYTGDFTYMQVWLDRLKNIMFQLLLNEPVTASVGNTESQVFLGQPASLDPVFRFEELASDIVSFIEFRTQSGDTDPSMTGSNNINGDLNYSRAHDIILENIKFLQAEAVAYLQFAQPAYEFTASRVMIDVQEFMRGIARDLKYSGNYASLLAARYYVNSTNGSATDDMFWVRDITGIRNCTLEGLQGSLNPPGVFSVFQRPTGGSFVSLDPGWGPDDDRCWIATRSPYIQGVTTIGTACVGQKIDGSLHNGGNTSIVSNDFTQVLSDGIGAWVLNNGRAELVSVFTYYCAVGYLAENGGKIRAANGNNSYGTYGSIATGIDTTEVPQQAKVNNRNNEAVVNRAFAGEVTDYILLFEYDTCGQNYTTATANITGAGNFAQTSYEDFRDGGIFQSRLINTADSGSTGGSGYTIVGNNAQAGNTTTITLASNDDNVEADYLGQRILITSGEGTGQYGYIQAYNPATKVATIYKESDDTPGWDHAVPGTDIVAALQTNSVYRIEPRLIVDHPGYTTSPITMPNSGSDPKDYTDIFFGSNTESYSGFVADLGTGSNDDSVEATPAQFSVVRIGETYNVTFSALGAGYAVGDSFTVSGADLGGDDITNDLTITVTEVTDDSTNSIVNFSTTGTPKDGIWVAISENGNYAAHSENGTNWSATTLPSTGNWNTIAAGNNRFVALKNEVTDSHAYSLDGKTWAGITLPASVLWTDIQYGNGRFVAIAENSQTAAASTDGVTWSSVSLPVGDDSSGDQWQAITFGQGKFLVVSGSQTKDVAYSTDGLTWSRYNNALPSGNFEWIDVAFGRNRFVALANDNITVAYSLDGETWKTSTMVSPDDSTPLNWKRMRYGNGVFVAVGDTGSREIGAEPTSGPTTFIATSEDGILWTARNIGYEKNWGSVGFGSPQGNPFWIAIEYGGNDAARINIGARAIFRADIFNGVFQRFKIWDPGSGYNPASPPTITIVDNSYTVGVEYENRIANRVLGQPSFSNRGLGYRTSSTQVTITGDGFADIIPEANAVTLKGLTTYPSPGAQFLFDTIFDEETEDPEDLKRYTAVVVTPLGSDGEGKLQASFQISPSLENQDNLAHNTDLIIRERYSQCRITGHDFLDIGTGNFEETNYPDLYAGGAYFIAAPENEVYEEDGGRIFYVSTDQDGNFRAGELFSVQQATGIVTISAEFFDLDGLSELALGGVRLGGSGVVIREFSTDPTFSEDSNNVVPTQRAIASFLANRLSEGGSELETNDLTAGLVRLGTEENIITHTGNGTIKFPKKMDFSGADPIYGPYGVQGMIWAQRYFMRNGE